MNRGELAFQRSKLRAPAVPGMACCHAVWLKKQRRLFELVEHEQQRAEQQDEELHRDLADGVEHQAEPALAQRSAAEM